MESYSTYFKCVCGGVFFTQQNVFEIHNKYLLWILAFHSFLLLSDVPLYEYTTHSFFTHFEWRVPKIFPVWGYFL